MNSKELQEEFLKYEAQDAERVINNLKITNPMFYQFLETIIEKARKYDELVEAEDND